MKKIERIVVPIDFSSITNKLTEYAFYIASHLGAVIDFIHVVEDFPEDAMMIGLPFAQEYEEKAMAASKKKIAHLVKNAQQICPGCSGESMRGDAVDQIVEFSAKKNADLIIISTHGAKGLERILLGSVAKHVLKNAPCPVLTMNPHKNKFN